MNIWKSDDYTVECPDHCPSLRRSHTTDRVLLCTRRTENSKRSMEANLLNPLEIVIENGQLIIKIGVDTLTAAAEGSEHFDFYDPKTHDFRLHYKVENKEQWAQDVRRALLDESEDGSNMFTRLMDRAFLHALDDGSEAVNYEYEAT